MPSDGKSSHYLWQDELKNIIANEKVKTYSNNKLNNT
jgi:hypothetical protein